MFVREITASWSGFRVPPRSVTLFQQGKAVWTMPGLRSILMTRWSPEVHADQVRVTVPSRSFSFKTPQTITLKDGQEITVDIPQTWDSTTGWVKFVTLPVRGVASLTLKVTAKTTGEPIVGAVANLNGTQYWTDNDGKVMWPSLAIGKYTYQVMKEGYGTKQSEVDIAVPESYEVNVKMGTIEEAQKAEAAGKFGGLALIVVAVILGIVLISKKGG